MLVMIRASIRDELLGLVRSHVCDAAQVMHKDVLPVLRQFEEQEGLATLRKFSTTVTRLRLDASEVARSAVGCGERWRVFLLCCRAGDVVLAVWCCCLSCGVMSVGHNCRSCDA